MITHRLKSPVPRVGMTTNLNGEDGRLERRIAPRSCVLDSRSLIGWFEDGRFVAFQARLLDISSAGAAVESWVPPPDGRDVGLCLIGDRDPTPMLAEVVDVDEGPSGGYIVRMAFWTPCPRRLLDLARHGPSRES